jgi:hypothetical protein
MHIPEVLLEVVEHVMFGLQIGFRPSELEQN